MIAISRTNSKQKSIKNYIDLQGIGLHSGIKTKLKLEEAPEDNGIKFIRQDKAKNNIIEAIWANVTATKLSTTISNKSDLSVSTIEHLMSALSGLHIDNVNIFIDGPEVPIMDGS